jgi:CRISPR-associated protein Csm1
VQAYSGELALVLALSEPLSGADFLREAWPQTWRRFLARREAAKLRVLAPVLTEPRLEVDFPAAGTCAACGVRPRVEPEGWCHSCAAEYELGRALPQAQAVFWRPAEGRGALFGRIVVEAKPTLPPALQRDELGGFAIGFRDASVRPTALPWRLFANHLPTWREGEWDDRRFEGAIETLEDIDRLEADSPVTLHHLARVDSEDINGRLLGRPMLAVLKADVDDLGQIFGRGLGPAADRSLGRTVALSRLMDAFFSGWLPWRLRTDERFRWIYTVYAGGDDLLLIGPWRTMLHFAVELREGFERFAAGNPDLHLSAAIELVDPDEPLNRSVRRAEDRLKSAKAAEGKDRVSVIVDEPLSWQQLGQALEIAETLCERVRKHDVPASFLHRLLVFADLEAKARSGQTQDLTVAMWNARFQYLLARQFPKDDGIRTWFADLIGRPGYPPKVPARIPLSIAIWRNR